MSTKVLSENKTISKNILSIFCFIKEVYFKKGDIQNFALWWYHLETTLATNDVETTLAKNDVKLLQHLKGSMQVSYKQFFPNSAPP